MHQHTHSGLLAFAYVTVAAIVGLNLVRLSAAWLAKNPKSEPIGNALGALVHFGS
jgi:hypothetical protein